MGSYIAFRFFVDTPGAHAHVLEPLFKHEHVAPSALAGLSGADDFFLGGCALEHFLTEYVNERTGRELRRVELAPIGEGEEPRYLRELVERARRREVTPWTLSPFERVDEQAGVTWLDAPPLGRETLPRFEAWRAQRPETLVEIDLSFAIATRDPERRPWKRAFQEQWRDEYLRKKISTGHPLLFVTVQNSPFNAGQTWVSMHSESQIWLRNAHALNGLVGVAEADENLARLSAVFHALLASTGAPVLDPQIHVSGSPFRAEAERFESAFRAIAEIEIS
jgi:hypothetical protein